MSVTPSIGTAPTLPTAPSEWERYPHKARYLYQTGEVELWFDNAQSIGEWKVLRLGKAEAPSISQLQFVTWLVGPAGPKAGQIISYGEVAGPDTSLLTQPSRATMVALERAGLSLSDVDLFEFNEAFAAVAVASMADLGIPDDIVNVNGGAIALGHPIGMSGARIAMHLAYELKRRGGGIGVAALCGGGGQGDALVIKVDDRS